jgi:hypothetical protein
MYVSQSYYEIKSCTYQYLYLNPVQHKSTFLKFSLRNFAHTNFYNEVRTYPPLGSACERELAPNKIELVPTKAKVCRKEDGCKKKCLFPHCCLDDVFLLETKMYFCRVCNNLMFPLLVCFVSGNKIVNFYFDHSSVVRERNPQL